MLLSYSKAKEGFFMFPWFTFGAPFLGGFLGGFLGNQFYPQRYPYYPPYRPYPPYPPYRRPFYGPYYR
ncbi:uroporphyrin-III methyltransferase [Metasolibacillus sp. FSL H7-0170]|uniref:hypothetical protein n=2 Tax=Caryophanaceae TaxID=186818 RepID=UPI00079C2355|nr:hypothetical protein [Metasolibacillus fluoroglycofenilyticus]KYG90759.1 hypothetical protein A0U40_05545 [[Bacillus] sp. KCTC 13219]